MSTDLEQRIREALHDDAARARLVNPDRPADTDAQPLTVSLHPTRSPRRRAAVAAAAAIALIVAASVAVIQTRDRAPGVTSTSEPSTTPDSTEVFPDLPTDVEIFPDLLPDATLDLPSAPIGALASPHGIWTGTELIVWSEPSTVDATPPPEGAAFDPETGTWRRIAPSPLRASAHAWRSSVAWTGDEMIVWGGQGVDGAAYDPDADTWRTLPEAPMTTGDGEAVLVWTGHEVIALALHDATVPRASGRDGQDRAVEAAAYDPATDEWRVLAGPTGAFTELGPSVWTGTSLLTVLDVSDVEFSAQNDGHLRRLARLDLTTDSWHVDDDATYTSLVGVPDADGATRTVLAMPVEAGEPVDLLDAAGNPIRSFPLPSIDFNGYATISATGLWLGEEAVFWVNTTGTPLITGSEEAWALDPASGTWRPLPVAAEATSGPGGAAVAVGDVLLWSGMDGLIPGEPATGGVAYRAP